MYLGNVALDLGVGTMPDEKREKQEVAVEKPWGLEITSDQEVPEVLKNLQDTFNFYFKNDKEQS